MRVALGQFWASFGPYRCRLAGVMRIGAGLVGLKAKMCTPLEPEAKPRGPRRCQRKFATERGVLLFGHFSATLHTLGALGVQFGVTLCTRGSLWKRFGVFSKKSYFSNIFQLCYATVG